MKVLSPEELPERLRAALAGPAQALVEAAVDEALARSYRPYLVGGAVRDLLLRRPWRGDLDIVLEGDAVALAQTLARERGWRATLHGRFRTATLRADGVGLDLTTARRERYARPGVLPAVETPAPLDEDLFRRDFTINAMALGLAPEDRGRLYDPYGGQADLQAGLVRVLHGRSFRDDATRLWRACRYAARLGLRLERATARLARQDAGYTLSVGADRMRHEIERIFGEERPERALALAQRYGLLSQVHAGLAGEGWIARRFAAARRRYGEISIAPPGELGSIYWGLWLYRLPEPAIKDILRTLNIVGARAVTLRSLPSVRAALAGLRRGARASTVARRLDDYEAPALQVAWLAEGAGQRRAVVARYLREMQAVRPLLRGDEVRALGVPTGPQLRRALTALREARLDKRAKTREDEMALVRRLRASGRLGS